MLDFASRTPEWVHNFPYLNGKFARECTAIEDPEQCKKAYGCALDGRHCQPLGFIALLALRQCEELQAKQLTSSSYCPFGTVIDGQCHCVVNKECQYLITKDECEKVPVLAPGCAWDDASNTCTTTEKPCVDRTVDECAQGNKLRCFWDDKNGKSGQCTEMTSCKDINDEASCDSSNTCEWKGSLCGATIDYCNSLSDDKDTCQLGSSIDCNWGEEYYFSLQGQTGKCFPDYCDRSKKCNEESGCYTIHGGCSLLGVVLQDLSRCLDFRTDNHQWCEYMGGIWKNNECDCTVQKECEYLVTEDECEKVPVSAPGCSWDTETKTCSEKFCDKRVGQEECLDGKLKCRWNEGKCSYKDSRCRDFVNAPDCLKNQCGWNYDKDRCEKTKFLQG